MNASTLTGETIPEASAPTQAGNRLAFIEGMRGLAALYVVFQHICTMIDPQFRMMRPGAQPAWLAQVMGGLWYGHFAVAAFIVLSGFCLQMSLYSKGDGRITHVGKFLKRRCWRILPPYYACLAFSLLVCHFVTQHQDGLPWSQYLPVTQENVLAHVFMVHNLSRDWMYKINGVLWSISIEFQLYFLFTLVARALWRAGGKVVVPAVAAIVAWALMTFPEAEKLYVWYFGLFVLGMVGARWAFDTRLPRPSYWGMMLVAMVSTGVALASIGWTKELYWRDSLMGVAVVALLIAGVLRPDALWAKGLGLKPLAVLGAFSYSLYLMHHPILQVVFVNRPEWASTVTRQFGFLVASVPLILLLCWMFYWLFERPFIGWGRSKPKPSAPQVEPA